MRAVTIELDRPRRLRFDVNALADAEERLGMGLGRIMQQEASFALLRTLLWAGLRHEDRRLTPEAAGTLLQQHIAGGGDLETVAARVMEAILASGLFSERVDDDPNAESSQTAT